MVVIYSYKGQMTSFPTVSQQVCQSLERSPVETQRISSSDRSHFRTIERQASFDDRFQTTIRCSRRGGVTVVRPQPRTVSVDLDLFSSEENTPTQEITPRRALSAPNGPPNTLALLATVSADSSVKHLSQVDSFEGETTLMEACPSDPEQDDQRASPVTLTDLSESARPENGLSKDETKAIVDPESTLSDGSESQNGTERKAAIPDTLASDKTTSTPTDTGSMYVPAQSLMVEPLGNTDILEQHGAMAEPGEMAATNPISLSNGDWAEANQDGGATVTDREAEEGPPTNQTADVSQDATKAEQQEKKKGKQCSGVHLH